MLSRFVNVLLVDDDSVDVMNVQRAFKKNNIRNPLWLAADGIEALAILRGTSLPDERRLVLLDLNMPKMNGLEFLRALREDPALAPTTVIVLTTSLDLRDRIEAYRFNVAGYLLKPVAFHDFVSLMAALNTFWEYVSLP